MLEKLTNLFLVLATLCCYFYYITTVYGFSNQIGIQDLFQKQVSNEQSSNNNNNDDYIASNYFPPKLSGSSSTDYVSSTDYNYCNMPHVNTNNYKIPPQDYKLRYLEVIQRHHKRTPYQSNMFPKEDLPYSCDDLDSYYYSTSSSISPNKEVAHISWNVQQVLQGPLKDLYKGSLNTSCQFPQITSGGLLDSKNHGEDIYKVYHTMLEFLPSKYSPDKISYRVSTNSITSQVAGALIKGTYPDAQHVSVEVQPDVVDTLNANYPCSGADSLRSKIESDDSWKKRHSDMSALFQLLDEVSGVSSSDIGWHQTIDHYFDNLSFRTCHQLPYPCSDLDNGSNKCITEADALKVFELGDWEYNYLYREAEKATEYSAAKALYLYELLKNIEDKESGIIYRHNFAHDNTIASILGALQIYPKLKWPGMGSEIVFEVWSKGNGDESDEDTAVIRVLYGGSPLKTIQKAKGEGSAKNNPIEEEWDMIPISKFSSKIKEVLGENGEKVIATCQSNLNEN